MKNLCIFTFRPNLEKNYYISFKLILNYFFFLIFFLFRTLKAILINKKFIIYLNLQKFK